jgi:DNA-binding CsgD family transcriptional regulator
MPVLRQALSAFRGQEVGIEDRLRWSWLAGQLAGFTWDYESWDVLTTRQIQVARDTGALTVLPLTLTTRTALHLLAGELALAASVVEQVEALADTIAYQPAVAVAAFRGRGSPARDLIGASTKDFLARGDGLGLNIALWATAVLNNALARYGDAFVAAERLLEDPHEVLFSPWACVELIEAASRIGKGVAAAPALERLARATSASGTGWAAAIEARCRALLSEGEAAEALYRQAIEQLAPTALRFDLARTHLLYGEWLRRERRQVDGREHLRVAHRLFSDFGMEGFAERARVELRATGEHAGEETAENSNDLTPQEARISLLVSQGATNREIAAQLFIGPSTVEYHLHKVFRKLGVKSRTQLARWVAGDGVKR